LILDIFPLRRLASLPVPKRAVALLWDKAPFFVLAGAAGARAWVAQVEAGAMYPLIEHGALSRAAQALYGLGFYAWKTLLPIDLGPLYQIPHRDVLFGALLWKGLLGSALLLVLALASRRRWPAVTAAIAAYVIIIIPVSGIFSAVRNSSPITTATSRVLVSRLCLCDYFSSPTRGSGDCETQQA
jgi:hypothetical protein